MYLSEQTATLLCSKERNPATTNADQRVPYCLYIVVCCADGFYSNMYVYQNLVGHILLAH